MIEYAPTLIFLLILVALYAFSRWMGVRRTKKLHREINRVHDILSGRIVIEKRTPDPEVTWHWFKGTDVMLKEVKRVAIVQVNHNKGTATPLVSIDSDDELMYFLTVRDADGCINYVVTDGTKYAQAMAYDNFSIDLLHYGKLHGKLGKQDRYLLNGSAAKLVDKFLI